MNKPEVVRLLLGDRPTRPAKAQGRAYAPANIALCKYWGKRDDELNLPVTSSLSISLGRHGTETAVIPAARDEVVLNGEALDPAGGFARRVREFLDLVRSPGLGLRVETTNTIPTAAGLASSASGFAALTLALDDLFGWRLPLASLSVLARLGSGSAARSVGHGFVKWHAGARDDGMDSFAERIDIEWPEFRVGLVTVSADEKPVGSREAMKRTRDTSRLYQAWPAQVAADLAAIEAALRARDFAALGRAAEGNALAMHATMMAAWPPVLYWRPESVAAMHRLWQLRAEGVPVYFTMDAGPNLKFLYLAPAAGPVRAAFPDLVEIAPFASS